MAKSHNLLKIGEASVLLGLHPNTLRNWEKQGKITPHVRFQGTGTRYYKREDLEALKLDVRNDSFRTVEQLEQELGVDLTNCRWALGEPYYEKGRVEAMLPEIREYLKAIM